MGRSSDAYIHYGVQLPHENTDTGEDHPWVENHKQILDNLGVDPDESLDDETLFLLMNGEKRARYEDNKDEWRAQHARKREWVKSTGLEITVGGSLRR